MIRYNPITGEPVLLAAHRAERPDHFRDGAAECPFCPGNEALTPPEVSRRGEPWHVRAFPNKYPAAEHHEVIVESARHDATFDELAPAEATDALSMYVERYAELMSRDGVRAVCLFKNHGVRAGASIPHLHSQALATSFVPPRVQREIDGFAGAGACPLCGDFGEVIGATHHFARVVPYGSSMPYEQWIVPREHANEMTSLAAADELAALLQRAAAAVRGNDFNWIFVNFPREPRAHWYVQLFARTGVWAGFELGSGTAIETVDPADAARYLRQ